MTRHGAQCVLIDCTRTASYGMWCWGHRPAGKKPTYVVQLDPAFHTQLKLHCKRKDVSMTAFVESACLDAITKKPE